MKTIYDIVKEKILSLGVEKLQLNEFYLLVENIKICNNDVVEVIYKDLIKMGLTPNASERICSSLAWKIRFTKRDARDIEKHLRNSGFFHREHYNLVINNHS